MSLIEFHGDQRKQLAHVFSGHNPGLIPVAILEGQIGKVFADSDTPRFAVLEVPEAKVAILGGDARHPLAHSYMQRLPRYTNLFFTSADFATLAHQIHPKTWVEFTRHAFSAEQLDLSRINTFKAKLPAGIRVERISLSLAKQLTERENRFAEAHTLSFESPEDFVARGIGYCALAGNQIVCVASSFAVCEGGIEIQIDTSRKFKGRGIATSVAAHLIAHCLENDLTPSWDAATEISAQFAKKLGYVEVAAYPMLVFTDSKLLIALRNQVQKVKPSIERFRARRRLRTPKPA